MGLALDIIRALFDPPTPRAPVGPATAPGPAPYRGTSTTQDRRTRIEREVMMIAPHFADRGGLYYDDQNGDWLQVPKYPLPARWQDRWCQLLILLPAAYPATPPNGFYLSRKFELAGGGRDQHLTGAAYHGADDLSGQGWFWYCVQTLTTSQGGWRPSADYSEPDNLWSVLNTIRDVLTNDA